MSLNFLQINICSNFAPEIRSNDEKQALYIKLMRKLFFFFAALMAMSFSSCKQTTGQVTWRFYPSPDGTETAQDVTNRLEDQMRVSYQELGSYQAPYTDGGASFGGAVRGIKGKTYEEIRDKVAASTTSMAKALENFKFGDIDSCKIIVTLFIDNAPTTMFDKTYAGSVVPKPVVTPIVFRGDTLQWNTEFKRTKTGMSPSAMVEISGLACSRVTPGYLWAQSDDNYRVIAMTEDGKKIQLDILLTDKPTRKDWEDMCIGNYQGKSTIFVGGFGDNNLKYLDNSYIFYFDEPAIPTEAKKDTFHVNSNYILFGYPDNKAHDAEAMMYDNIDNVLFVIDKSDRGICTVYKLPMNVTYNNELQRLTEVCKLGAEGDQPIFNRVTAADMSPDGRWIIIKNYDVYKEKQYALIWERKEGESVDEALARQPQQIKAYEKEWQGEAVAWLDNTTFYTTSDEDGSAPIYKYVR